MNIEVSPEELSELNRIIAGYADELSTEIQHTDNFEFREQLKEEQATVSALMKRFIGLENRPQDVPRW